MRDDGPRGAKQVSICSGISVDQFLRRLDGSVEILQVIQVVSGSAQGAKKEEDGGNTADEETTNQTDAAKAKSGNNSLETPTPGNDVESTTALAGAGANMILFSTGLGTPTGNPVTPVIKVSSNTKTAERMSDIIDFNAGVIISGEKSMAQTAADLLDLCIRTASGEVTCKADLLGQDDFIPWKRGISL